MIPAERTAPPVRLLALEAAALAAVFAWCYATVIVELVRTWATNPLYSYGFAVPIISGYIVATRWAQLRQETLAPDYLFGSLTLAAAAVLLLIGDIGSAQRLQQISFVVAIAGLVLLACGRRIFRIVWFAVAFLALMVPIWTELIGRLQVPSQLISGRIAVALFHAIRIPAVQDGTLIYLPQVTLEVLRECSGVNQLVAIFAVTVPAAYLWLEGHWRRIALVTASLAVGYLSNGFRITLIGILAQNGFPTSDPTVHMLEGLAVATIGYGLVGALFSMLAKPGWFASGVDEDGAAPAPVVFGARRPWLDAALAILLLACGSASVAMPRSDIHLKEDLRAFPYRIDVWTREESPAPRDIQSGDVDDQLWLTYRRITGERVRLHIGYQRHQQAGKGLAIGVPRVDGGIASVVDVNVTNALSQLNQIEQRSGSAAMGVLYWYDVDGRLSANRYRANSYLLWNALTTGRTNGAVVSVVWESGPSDFEHSRERAVEFIRGLLPVLPNYLPSSQA